MKPHIQLETGDSESGMVFSDELALASHAGHGSRDPLNGGYLLAAEGPQPGQQQLQRRHELLSIRGLPGPLAAKPPAPPPPASPSRMAHRALRGRYREMILLGIFGALLGAIAGRFATSPQYRSEGLIK